MLRTEALSFEALALLALPIQPRKRFCLFLQRATGAAALLTSIASDFRWQLTTVSHCIFSNALRGWLVIRFFLFLHGKISCVEILLVLGGKYPHRRRLKTSPARQFVAEHEVHLLVVRFVWRGN